MTQRERLVHATALQLLQAFQSKSSETLVELVMEHCRGLQERRRAFGGSRMNLKDQEQYIARRNLDAFLYTCEFIEAHAKPVEAFQLTPHYTFDLYTHHVLVYDDCGTLLRTAHRLWVGLPSNIVMLCQDIVYQHRHNVFSWQIYLRDNFIEVPQGHQHKDYRRDTFST